MFKTEAVKILCPVQFFRLFPIPALLQHNPLHEKKKKKMEQLVEG